MKNLKTKLIGSLAMAAAALPLIATADDWTQWGGGPSRNMISPSDDPMPLDIKGGKKHYASLFPTEFKKKQLDTMDEDGIVLPGTIVNEGDPLVLATSTKAVSSNSAQTGRLSKALAQARASAAQVWDHEDQGVVTDVARTKISINNKGE